jgi:hypothetical protein
MSAKLLDFLGIGAARAGSTSLFEYMRTHPELYLPPAKEQPFFSNDAVFLRGWDAYARYAFYQAPPNRLIGKITPQYLGGPFQWREDTIRQARRDPTMIVPRRIASVFPDVKLIVLLRDPVARATSHYWLEVMQGREHRSLRHAIAESLSPQALEGARISPRATTSYVTAGEYGRLLAGFLSVFPRSRLFVGSSHELAQDPIRVLRSLWRFLDVDEAHVPGNLDVRYGGGTARRRLRRLDPKLVPRFVRGTPVIRGIWHLLPGGTQNRIRARYRAAKYRINLWNRASVPSEARPEDAEVAEILKRHYESDLATLHELIGPLPGVTSDLGRVAPPAC